MCYNLQTKDKLVIYCSTKLGPISQNLYYPLYSQHLCVIIRPIGQFWASLSSFQNLTIQLLYSNTVEIQMPDMITRNIQILNTLVQFKLICAFLVWFSSKPFKFWTTAPYSRDLNTDHLNKKLCSLVFRFPLYLNFELF